MKKIYLGKFIASCLLAAFMSGCVMWQKGTAEKISPPSPPAAPVDATDKIFIWVTAYATPPKRNMGKFDNETLVYARRALIETGHFEITSVEQATDYYLDIRVVSFKKVGLAVFSTVVSAASLTTIPTYKLLSYEYVATLRSKKHQVVGTHAISQRRSVLIWLPLIVATPFVVPFNTTGKVKERVSRDIAAWCYEQIQQHVKNPAEPTPSSASIHSVQNK